MTPQAQFEKIRPDCAVDWNGENQVGESGLVFNEVKAQDKYLPVSLDRC